MHRYQEEPSFNFFQVGAEICLDPLDAKAQASGKIYDYSISGTNIKFKTFSESNPADPYKFSYFQQSWSNNDLQRDAVNFFGGEKGISCESTLIEIIGGTLGGLLLIGSISYLFYYGRSHGWCAGSNVDQNADYTIIEG